MDANENILKEIIKSIKFLPDSWFSEAENFPNLDDQRHFPALSQKRMLPESRSLSVRMPQLKKLKRESRTFSLSEWNKSEGSSNSINHRKGMPIKNQNNPSTLLAPVLPLKEPDLTNTHSVNSLTIHSPHGGNALQLCQADRVAISSLAAVCHCKELERARLCINEKELRADGTLAAMKLLVDLKGEKVEVTVVKKTGSYTITGPAGNGEVVDNFSLTDGLIETKLNGERFVAQLIKVDPSGQLRIR